MTSTFIAGTTGEVKIRQPRKMARAEFRIVARETGVDQLICEPNSRFVKSGDPGKIRTSDLRFEKPQEVKAKPNRMRDQSLVSNTCRVFEWH